MDVDPKIPKYANGPDSYDNLQLLHGHCHDTKSTSDLILYSKKNLKRGNNFPE